MPLKKESLTCWKCCSSFNLPLLIMLTPQLPLSNLTPSYLYPAGKIEARTVTKEPAFIKPTQAYRSLRVNRFTFRAQLFFKPSLSNFTLSWRDSHLLEWSQCTQRTEADSSPLQLLVWSVIAHRQKNRHVLYERKHRVSLSSSTEGILPVGPHRTQNLLCWLFWKYKYKADLASLDCWFILINTFDLLDFNLTS